ncbi:DNA-binding bromodomain-containing protein [Striga asiatica]|uniref:DNA-binding bromodomain-containing protein n=1 Tax=Striga asiatica TaxID=4170 RepID=A0A5A7QBR7_STRAF|nr:DNA-binding bromodomain-containing protein [Striga asiatica]
MKMREQRRQEQDRYMNQDLRKFSPTHRAYYELKKTEILKDLENEFPHGSNICRVNIYTNALIFVYKTFSGHMMSISLGSTKFRSTHMNWGLEVLVINVLSSAFLWFVYYSFGDDRYVSV